MPAKRKAKIDTAKLRDYLTAHGIEPTEISYKIGASKWYLNINKILSGSNTEVSQMAYVAICNALQVPETTFLVQENPAPTISEERAEQLDRIEKQFDRIETQFDRIEKQLGWIEKKLNEI